VRLEAGPGVAQVWTSAAGVPGSSSAAPSPPRRPPPGVPFEAVRDYLLSLPGLPDEVAAQLRTFAADGSTLPLPVPRRPGHDTVGRGGRRARPRCCHP
jgi:hypothetical protein